ncbi:BTAD domain-containing putative transcriptional regulator [Amycolatopsis sp. TRM77291]
MAVLLGRANEPVSADVLVDALWGAGPVQGSLQRLQVHMHRIRALLDVPERLSFGSDGYCLRVGPDELDAHRFDVLLEEASRVAARDPRRCAELIREALGLWRGTPYQGVDVPELIGEVQRLSERMLLAVEDLYTAELRCGRHGEITGELTELVRRHPLRERLHGLLMTALYQGGRQADAMAAYRHARGVLADELGLDPGPELRALENRILRGDPIELSTPEPAPARVPAQVPHDISGFVGRESDLSALDELLAEVDGKTPVAVVTGTGGVGKTALAVRWAHRVKDRFPDGQLYVDLRGYGPDSPMSPEDALASFLRAFEMDSSAIPQELTERAARFRSVVDGKRLLILLDNAHSAAQVRPLLPGAPMCLVVVTSRDSLGGLVAREGAHRVCLGRMSFREARLLLVERLGDRCTEESAETTQLIERCVRLPLALRIAAERLREHPDHLAALVTELDDEHARLDLLDSGDDPDASVRAVFFSSYRNLAPETARLFRMFGVHPGHDVDAYALTALAGNGDLRTTRRLLDTLVRANLVDVTDEHRYVLHDLLATYAAELAGTIDTATERVSALARLLDYYLYTAAMAVRFIVPNGLEISELTVNADVTAAPNLSSYDAALRWLDAERTNLLRAAAAAKRDLPAYTTSLSRVLSWYFDAGMYLDEAWQLQANALDTAREHGDLVAEGISLRTFGLVSLCAHRFDDAARYFEDSLALHQKAGAPLFQAATLHHFGALCGFAGRVEEGIGHLLRSAELFHELGHRLMEQWPLTALGQLHLRQGRPDVALEYLAPAFATVDRHNYRAGQFQASYGLAGAYRDIGRYSDALAFAHRALTFARSTRFPVFEVITLHRLGTIHLRLGDHEQAARHQHQALAMAENFTDTQLKATTLNGLGETYAAAGASTEITRRYHLEALAAATDIGVRYEEARALDGLGDVHHRRGEHDKAIDHWQLALTCYREVRAPKIIELQEKIANAQRETATTEV